MSERRGKKRSKSYYKKCSNKRQRRANMLGVNMKGFLATCNNNEKGAVRELFNILNEYADELYGPEQVKNNDNLGNVDSSGAAREEEEEEDMEKAMVKEIMTLKDMVAHGHRRFQNIFSNAKNCIFIQTTLDNPDQLSHAIFQDLAEKKIQKTRFALRLLPIQGTCRADIDSIKNLAFVLFPCFFSMGEESGHTYSINVKVRNNSSGLGKDSIIPELGKIILELNPWNRVEHSCPDYVVLVEIVCNICCLGIVRDYFKFRKYNLLEVGKGRPAVDTSSKEEQVEKTAEKVEEAVKSKRNNDGQDTEKNSETAYVKIEVKELLESAGMNKTNCGNSFVAVEGGTVFDSLRERSVGEKVVEMVKTETEEKELLEKAESRNTDTVTNAGR